MKTYRPLLIALFASALLCLGLFLLSLRMEISRAQVAFGASVVESGAHGAARLDRFLETITAIAADRRLGNGTLSPVLWLERSGALALVSVVCEVDADEAVVLHDALGIDSPDACREGTRFPFARPAGPPRTPAEPGGARPGAAAALDGPLFIESNLDGAHSMLYRLNTDALLRLFHPRALHSDGIDSDVCLSTLVGADSRAVACDRSHPAVLGSLAPTEWLPFEAGGIEWVVAARAHSSDMLRHVSGAPFIVLGVAMMLCGGVCWAVYRSIGRAATLAEQNVRLAHVLELLEQQNQDLGQFATLAAHDLQTPLRAMVNQTHLMELDIEEHHFDALATHARTILREGDRMRELILGLLAFCQAGQDTLALGSLDPEPIVSAQLKAFDKERHHTTIDLGELPKSVRADPAKLALIFYNLLDNAIKFSLDREHPHVRIRSSRCPERAAWAFVVEDNGCGIPPAMRTRVFRPFCRLGTDLAGAGIGLAVAKKLVERHGGNIVAEFSELGGTAVRFTLPDTPPIGPMATVSD